MAEAAGCKEKQTSSREAREAPTRAPRRAPRGFQAKLFTGRRAKYTRTWWGARGNNSLPAQCKVLASVVQSDCKQALPCAAVCPALLLSPLPLLGAALESPQGNS